MMDIKDKEYSIAIVGGGAAGVSMLAELVDSFIAKKNKGAISENDLHAIKLHIIESADQIGFGLPYSAKNKNHILNLDAKTMSNTVPLVKGSINFIKWAGEYKSIEVHDNDFMPRYLFGEYINYLFQKVKALAFKNNMKIRFHTESQVISIVKTQEEYVLTMQTKLEIKANYVVLAIGHLPPSNYREFNGKKGFFPSIWHNDCSIANIPKDAKVVILGARLTAIDAVIALRDNGHAGKVTMVSRSGILPAVLGPVQNYTKKYLTLENLNTLTLGGLKKIKLEQLFNLFWKEIIEAEGKQVSKDSILKPSISAIDWLAKQIDTAEHDKVRPWQNVLFSIYPIVPELWANLEPESKQEFLEKYNSIWMTYLAAFPLQNAKKILSFLREGYLDVKGGFKKLTYNENEETYDVSFEDGTHYECYYIIDCTGSCYNLEKARHDSKLIDYLVKSGLLVPNQHGGAHVNVTTFCAEDSSGAQIKHLYALGELAKGDSLATTDLGQVKKHIQQASFALINSIVRSMRNELKVKATVTSPTSVSEPEPAGAHTLYGS